MKKLIILLALVALVVPPVFAAEYEGGNLQVVSELPLGTPSVATQPIDTPAATNIEYSNLATFQGGGVTNGGATLQGANTITRLLADDITPTGTNAGIDVYQFKFTVVNFNTASVSFRPRARFWFANGAGGAPGTYYNLPVAVGFTFNAVTVSGLTVTTFTATLPAGQFTMPGGTFWAGLTFDNADGTTGATAALLNNLGQGLFDPPTIGSSADQYFVTQAAGSFFNIANPAGALANLGGNPPANFGWEFSVDVPVGVEANDWGVIKRLYR